MTSIRLELQDVAAGYGARVVFYGITLSLRQGETLVVAGANGSGKSTFLRLLCGLQAPTRGNVFYDWNDARYDPRDAGSLIGWVAPDLALYRELTGSENLRFFAAVRGLALHNEQIDELLAYVGLGGRGDDWVASYSSGMTHRMRYAYALMHKPPVLLLDEPTVTFDERGVELVERVVQTQRQRGITVIATNDARELRFADYVLTLGGV